MLRALRAGLLLLLIGLSSCAGSGTRSSDPMTALRNPLLPVPRRVEALDRAWTGSPQSRAEAREAVRAIAWSAESPEPLRLAALRRLLGDPESAPEARRTALLMLPLEPSLDVVEILGDAAAANGWVDATPALVRSFARPGAGPDSERPERASLLALHPDQTIEQVVFGVFLRPDPLHPGGDGARRARTAAWNLLGRLDADGSVRAAMLAAQNQTPEADQEEVLGDLQACLQDLRAVPDTGEELEWLRSLRDPAVALNAAWWSQAGAAIARLNPEQTSGLRLFHAEPVRWAASFRPQWLDADRASLLALAADRLGDRQVHQRQVRADPSKRPGSQRLDEAASRMTWGDLLSLLVLDEAARDPALVVEVLAQATRDHADRTTEYGGLLFLAPRTPRASPYPPRPSQRHGDTQFVASADMLDQGDLAAAHYHFHVAETFNSSFSGPSEADLAYAARYGRACLVFTSISHGVLSVDYYQPGGVVLDLGVLRGSER